MNPEMHPLETTINLYLESLPGYENSLHGKLTIKKYGDCLKISQHSLLIYMKSRGINTVEQLKIEDLEQYKDQLLNKLAFNNVKSFVTSTRGMLNYSNRMGWIQDIGKKFHLPTVKQYKNPIKPIPSEVEKEILGGNWGINSFTIARNRLIACLILKRGLTPMEFEAILEEHIKPFDNLGCITVFGKKKKSREVLLDTETLEALRIYMIERAHHMLIKRINTQHIFLSLIPQNGSYSIKKSGVGAVLSRIKKELRIRGYVFDLSGLNSQNCRRIALMKSYKQTNCVPIPHVDLTLSGQHGYGIGTVPTYNRKTNNWRRSLKNAKQIINHIEENKTDSDEESRVTSLQGIYPESSFFKNFGISTPRSTPVWPSSKQSAVSNVTAACKSQKIVKPDRAALREHLDRLGYVMVAKFYGTSKMTIRKWSGNYVVSGVTPNKNELAAIFQAEGI